MLVFSLLFAWLWPAAGWGISETCREWLQEHEDWRVEVVGLYLRGGSQRELDGAVFELLQRESVGDLVHPRAAVLVRERGAEKPEVGDLLDAVLGERPVLEPLPDAGQEPVGYPPARRVADELLLVGKLIVDGDEFVE